jgi:hypothetical protein
MLLNLHGLQIAEAQMRRSEWITQLKDLLVRQIERIRHPGMIQHKPTPITRKKPRKDYARYA